MTHCLAPKNNADWTARGGGWYRGPGLNWQVVAIGGWYSMTVGGLPHMQNGLGIKKEVSMRQKRIAAEWEQQ